MACLQRMVAVHHGLAHALHIFGTGVGEGRGLDLTQQRQVLHGHDFRSGWPRVFEVRGL